MRAARRPNAPAIARPATVTSYNRSFMAPFFPSQRCVRRPHAAAAVAAVPYDVVNTDEARALADGNPLSFLHVSRAEIDLPAGTDPYADAVYERAAENFRDLRTRAPLVEEDAPAFYVYRLHMGAHTQTGIAACFSIDEYDDDLIKKHEKTRPDKEDDRTRHMLAIGAQTGPVFLTYAASPAIDAIVDAHDGGDAALRLRRAGRHPARHLDGGRRGRSRASSTGFARDSRSSTSPTAIIARPARRARAARSRAAAPGEHDRVLAVAFPDNQMQILPYNRVVKDLNGLTPAQFLDARRGARAGHASAAADAAARKGQAAMYLDGRWYATRVSAAAAAGATRRRRSTSACLQDAGARAGARHPGRAHRQAHRFRRRHSRHRRARSAWSTPGSPPSHSRCIPVTIDDLMHDRRRRRHHAAQVDLVRAEAARRPAVAPHLSAVHETFSSPTSSSSPASTASQASAARSSTSRT